MAWRKKKNTFRSRRKEIRLYRKHFLVSGSVACGVLLLGVLVWYGARRPEVTVTAISVSGGDTVSHDVIQNKVESVLSGTYAFLIPRRFSFLLPKQEIANAIDAIPRVHNASVVRTSRNTLAVSFDEYVPYALWCDSVKETATSTSSCIFVDEQGYAYADAPALFGETLVRFVIEGRKPEKGAHVYDAKTLTHYQSFSDAIASHHQHRLRAITETVDGDLTLNLSGDVNLLIAKDANIQTIFENIESILQSDTFKGKPFESFEYIDLRFGNKVYVKERGAGEEGGATTTVSGPLAPTLGESTTTFIPPIAPLSTSTVR